MSDIYEVLIENRDRSLKDVAVTVAEALGIQVSDVQRNDFEIDLESDTPISVTTADYDDEGPTMMVNRYNYTVYSWDLATTELAYESIEAATDWPIALFNEELYQITRRRDPLAVSA